jgi:hypothetical protein
VYPQVELLVEKLSDFSFPSGHTYSAFLGATILFYMNRKIGYAAFVFAVLTAFRDCTCLCIIRRCARWNCHGVAIGVFSMFLVKTLKKRVQLKKLENGV